MLTQNDKNATKEAC